MKTSIPLTDVKCNTIIHCKLPRASTGNKSPPGVGAPFHLCSTNKKKLNGTYNAIKHLGLENMNLNKTSKKRTKKYIMKAYHNERHFIHKFIHKLLSGPLQTYRNIAIGKSCF